MQNALLPQLLTILKAISGTDLNDPDYPLFEAGLLDSANFVDLLVELEQIFGVAFTDQDLETDHFETPRRLAELIAARLSATRLSATRLSASRGEQDVEIDKTEHAAH